VEVFVTDLTKTFPSWAGLFLAPPACAVAGWRLAVRTHDFTELQGIIGGAVAGAVGGLIIWAVDIRRRRSRIQGE
jgi:hypothetical protein